MSLQALIFDVDGTLAETEELHRASFNEAFAQARLSWTWDRALYAELLEVTGGKERISHYIQMKRATPPLDRDAIARLHRTKTSIYANAVARGAVSLRPGVRRILSEAWQRGLPVAIATTTSRENVDALLQSSLGADAARRFAFIAAGDSVPAKKPAPDIYELALQRLGLAGRDTIAFEDTPNGLRSARGAGIDVVITRSIFGGELGFEDALTVLDHLGDPGNICHVLQGRGIAGGMVTIDGLELMRGEGR